MHYHHFPNTVAITHISNKVSFLFKHLLCIPIHTLGHQVKPITPRLLSKVFKNWFYLLSRVFHLPTPNFNTTCLLKFPECGSYLEKFVLKFPIWLELIQVHLNQECEPQTALLHVASSDVFALPICWISIIYHPVLTNFYKRHLEVFLNSYASFFFPPIFIDFWRMGAKSWPSFLLLARLSK